MNLQIIAGQPIKFWVAMEDESDPPIFQAADSTPTLQTLRKNGSSVTPGGGELVIGSVDSPNGYYVTFTPATLPAVGDNYLFTIQYLVSSVTNLLEYEGVAVPSSGGGGGGGDATLAKQNEILGYLTGGEVSVTSPVVSAGLIETVEGLTYDGTNEAKLFWTVAKDYTGRTITLYAWRNTENDDGTVTKTMMKTATGSVASSTRVEIASLTSTFDSAIEFTGCPEPVEVLRFSLVATNGGNDEEIDRGAWYVYQGPDS